MIGPSLGAYHGEPIIRSLLLGAYHWETIIGSLSFGAYLWKPKIGSLSLGNYHLEPTLVEQQIGHQTTVYYGRGHLSVNRTLIIHHPNFKSMNRDRGAGRG